jgi:hypothetical protein
MTVMRVTDYTILAILRYRLHCNCASIAPFGLPGPFTSRASLAAITVSAAGGVINGCLRSDWSGAFGLASLLIGVLAVLLAVSSGSEYLGLERPVDDQVDLEGGKDDLTTPILQRVFKEEAVEVGRV